MNHQDVSESDEQVHSPPLCYNQKMVKRVKEPQAPLRKSRNIANCLKEGHLFARPKRAMTTRSMSAAAEAVRARREEQCRFLEADRRIRKPKRQPKKTRDARRQARVHLSHPLPTHVPLPAPPIKKSIPKDQVARLVGPIKKTAFKAQKASNLPLPAFGFIDVCFCIDVTGSMGSELEQAKSTIQAIVTKLEQKVATEGITLRFAVLHYLDHDCGAPYVTKWKDFTDAGEAIEYTKTLSLDSGGDLPEAVHDAVIDACTKLNWVELPGTPMLRYIFHIADAPPHGKEFGNYHKNGCKCGLTTDQMFHEVNMKQIHYRLIKVRPDQQLKQMQNIFRKGCVNFDCADIKHAKEMDVRVSDMIIHEVLPQG